MVESPILDFKHKLNKGETMSNIGKLIVLGAVGVVGYYTFIKKEQIPFLNEAASATKGIMQEANKDFVEHKVGTEKEYMDRNATVLQDDPSMRAITKNQGQ